MNYETGKPATIKYTRNTEGAAQYAPGGKYNEIVPGRYMVERTDSYNAPDARWQTGEVSFQNPLVVDYASGQWKENLSNQYGGKTGKALSNTLRKAGYDGIITHDKYGTSEIVDLAEPSKSDIALIRASKKNMAKKMAESEFKIKPPKKLYRGVAEDGSTAGTAYLGEGVYSTFTKGFASKYGKVIELDPMEHFPRNPLVIRPYGDQTGAFTDWLLKESGEKNIREFNKKYDRTDFVMARGYDGVIAGDEIVKFADKESRANYVPNTGTRYDRNPTPNEDSSKPGSIPSFLRKVKK